MKERKPIHDNWETPKDLYDKLNEEFSFNFDPCPLNSTFDGLDNNIKWGKVNFVNPPYSRKLKEAFIIRAYQEALKGNTSVLLLPVSTSTKIFHSYIYNIGYNSKIPEIRFLRGRVKFKGYNSKDELVSNKCGMHDSMIVIYRGI